MGTLPFVKAELQVYLHRKVLNLGTGPEAHVGYMGAGSLWAAGGGWDLHYDP